MHHLILPPYHYERDKMTDCDYSYRVKELSIMDRIKRGIVRRNFVKEISNYDVYLPPHSGDAQGLTTQQAQENFSFFNEQKSTRLRIIQTVLANYDLHIDHQKPDRREMLGLDGWAYQLWPGIFREHLWKKNVYSFDFRGIELNIRSLLFDVSVLLGECFINATKSSQWIVDCSDESRNKDAISFNRIVILETLPDEYAGKRDPVYDVESHVFYHYGAQKHSDLSKNTDKKMGEIVGFPRFRDFEYK
jgi:hypothetical protein